LQVLVVEAAAGVAAADLLELGIGPAVGDAIGMDLGLDCRL
jgi:hypothetical protein